MMATTIGHLVLVVGLGSTALLCASVFVTAALSPLFLVLETRA